MRAEGSTSNPGPTNAFDRAVKLWRAAAVYDRGELRKQGVHGPLRRFDEQAAGTRGVAGVKHLYNDALEQALHGFPKALVIARAVRKVIETINLAYDEATRASA
jgi:hypothetical protein